MGRIVGGKDGDVDPDAPTERITRGRRWTGGAANRTDESPDATGRFGRGEASRDKAQGHDDEEKTQRFGRQRGPQQTVDERPDEEMDELGVLPVGFLVVVDGPGLGHVAILQTGVNILGRSPDEQIPLDFGDQQISREDHVRFSYNRKTRLFRILPGKGPETWLKDELVDEGRTLQRGDLITVGATVLRFVPFCDEDFDWSEDEPA